MKNGTTNPDEIELRMQQEHGRSIRRGMITDRIKAKTKLFTNLAMCESQLRAFNDDFANNCLTGHTMMEWADRIEKLNKARTTILALIESKTKEIEQEKNAGLGDSGRPEIVKLR